MSKIVLVCVSDAWSAGNVVWNVKPTRTRLVLGWSCTLSGDFRKYRAYNCRPTSFGSDFDDKRRRYFHIFLFAFSASLQVSAVCSEPCSSGASRRCSPAGAHRRRVLAISSTDTFYARFLAGVPLNDLPDISEEKAKSDAAFAGHILHELRLVNQAKVVARRCHYN